MNTPTVRAIYRFPVKGFPGERLSAGFARAGTGLDGDRVVALSNGVEPPAPGHWADCTTLTALKSDTSLQQWQVSTQTRGTAADIELTAPDGASVRLASDDEVTLDAATPFLTERLTARGDSQRALVTAKQGMFDSRLCGLSLINPATVEALGRSAGAEIDPLRFRGNILLEGLKPYEEFAWVGAVLRLGDVRVWIRSAIERCSATRVNPATAEVDINVPHLLATHLGHLHCGIYGVILDGGQVHPGDPIIVERPPQPGAPPEAPPGAYKTRTYPRVATVEGLDISDGILALRLHDALGWTRAHYSVGQNLRVHPVIDGLPTWRTYTITAVTPHGDGDDIDLLIALDGLVSRHLASLPMGSPLVVSGPYGRVTAAELGRRPVTVTAGIGITPALALARSGTRIAALHIEREFEPSELSTQLDSLAELTHWSTQLQGRPTVTDLVAWLERQSPSSVLVCRPRGFGEGVRDAARIAGVTAVYEEVFTSPVLSQQTPDLPPAVIRIDGLEVSWEAADGFILDALEAAGLRLPSSCRAGACGTCELALRSGEVMYPLEPAAAHETAILSCSAYPVGDVELSQPE